jgi:flagellar M-ring protein FliF
MTYAAAGGGALLLALLAFAVLRGKKGQRNAAAPDLQLLTPGASVAQLEAALARDAAAMAPPLAEAPGRPALPDPAGALRERARELAMRDPTRAAHILRAWVAAEQRPGRNPNA